MALLRLLTPLALASSALAVPLSSRDNDGQGIAWGPCDFESLGSGPIQCANFSVPLDYTNETSTETLTLSLLKSPSRTNTTTVKKSILFNFGGPGYEAIHTLNAASDLLHIMTGGQHDLIAFDPRGVAGTATFSCFDTPAERALAQAKFPQLALNDHEDALADTFAYMRAFTNICAAKNEGLDTPEFVGTGFVARDLMSVVDALGEDGLLRYWGISYGSLLGATVAAMYPDRMDRVVLDGVVNAHNYYHRQGIDVDQFLQADASFRGILSACVEAGPEKCALAAINSTAADLEATLLRVADNYNHAPTAAGGTLINLRFVMELLFVVVKYPADVANATMHIANLVTGTNLTEVAAYYDAQMAAIALGNDDSTYGIKCSDTFPRADTIEDILPDIEHMVNSSEVFGEYIAGVGAQCAFWPWAARGRYGGPWEGIKTKTPVLWFSNTYDPVTPVANGKNMSAGFEGSVLVEQRGFGHGTISQLSNCTIQIMNSYFADATLPAEGTVCEVNTPLFQ